MGGSSVVESAGELMESLDGCRREQGGARYCLARLVRSWSRAVEQVFQTQKGLKELPDDRSLVPAWSRRKDARLLTARGRFEPCRRSLPLWSKR